MTHAAAYSILALTVGLSLARPRVGRLRFQPATAAILGAVLTVVVGLLPLERVAGVLGFLALPLLTIASLMVITLVAERAGIFRFLAWRVAKAAGGDGRRLFLYLFVLGTLTGAVFTNDAAVLIFTPMVWRLVEEVEDGWSPAQKIPYYFAVLYVANLVAPFVISNPINIIVSRWFSIGFLEYARVMVLPAIVSMVATYLGIRWWFRKTIPATYRIPERPAPITNRRFLVASSLVLVVTLAGFFSEEATGIPTAYVAALGAASVILVYRFTASGKPTAVARDVGWDALVFVTGIFIVANGLRAVGLTDVIGNMIMESWSSNPAPAMFKTGFVAAGCSAFMNNHPVADTMALAIRDLPLAEGDMRTLAFSALIGGDLGPKMLPIGSLAALLWFRILRGKGVEISYWTYIKIGIPLTLVAIALSLATLWAQFAVLGW